MGESTAEARHQVAAGILVRDAQVLLCHRSPDRAWYPDVWDLPGGHGVTGETPGDALVRELREELGIVITVPDEPEFARLVTPDFDCRMWVITEWEGTPSNLAPHEHDDVAWWSPREIGGLLLAHEAYPALLRRALVENSSRPVPPAPPRPAPLSAIATPWPGRSAGAGTEP